MAKPYEKEESAEVIQGLSDKDLNEYITDERFLRSSHRPFGVEESNRRQLNKVGKNTWLTIYTFVFVALAFLLAVLAFIFK